MSNTINSNVPPTTSTQSGEQVTPTADAAADKSLGDVNPEDLEKLKALMDQKQKGAEEELLLKQLANSMHTKPGQV